MSDALITGVEWMKGNGEKEEARRRAGACGTLARVDAVLRQL